MAAVLVDELGAPIRTNQWRRLLYRIMTDPGASKITPHGMWHSCLTYLATNGVPDVVMSAWAGHADLSFTKRVYVCPDGSHLAVAASALDGLLNPATGG